MSEEEAREIIKIEIENNIKNNLDSAIVFKYIQTLEQENTQLKKRVDMYENPEDLTLMFMYCDEKAKDKIKHLTSVLKEIREYIEDRYDYEQNVLTHTFGRDQIKDLFEIIDKAGIGEDNG